MTHAELLTACLKALNDPSIRPVERRLGIAWMASNKTQLARLLTRTEELIAQRENDPNSLEKWASSQKVSRATTKLNSDLSAPTRLWARDYQTTS
jgi:hypothetical protein